MQLHLFQLTATAASTVGFSCRLRGMQCFKTEFLLVHGYLLVDEIFSLFLGFAVFSSDCSETAVEWLLQLEVGLLFLFSQLLVGPLSPVGLAATALLPANALCALHLLH